MNGAPVKHSFIWETFVFFVSRHIGKIWWVLACLATGVVGWMIG